MITQHLPSIVRRSRLALAIAAVAAALIASGELPRAPQAALHATPVSFA